MAKKRNKMTQRELAALCRAEYYNADTYNSALDQAREDNMAFYLGLPLGNEVEGRSQVVSSDVADVVEAMMPPLVRIFAQAEDAVEFEPELYDEEGADMATRYVRHVVFKENEGFKLIHDQIKDGLLQKMGVLRWSWQEFKETREHIFDGMSVEEIAVLMEDLAGPKRTIEVVEQETVESEQGELYNVKLLVTEESGRVVVESITPEQVRIKQDLTELNNNTRYFGIVDRATRSELIERGFDRDRVMKLPAYEDDDSLDEEETRFADLGGASQHMGEAADPLSQTVEVIEQYIMVDWDNDGVAERRLVIMGGGEILYNERHDDLPVCLFSPIRIPHRAIGRCPADQAMEIQKINTFLWRGMIDNMSLVNAGRHVVRHGKDGVNVDDMLTVRQNGIIRTKGDPRSDVFPLKTQWIGDKAQVIMEYVKGVRQERTGVTNYTMGLDGDNLHDTATGFQGLTERTDERIELIARLYAETALKPMFYGVLSLLMKHQDTPRQIRILGKPIEINPRMWTEKFSVTCNVGLGTGRKEKQIAALSAVIQKQEQLMASGSPLVDMEKYHNALSMLIQKTDLYSPDKFFHDPSTPEFQQKMAMMAQQQGEPPADPLVQAEMIKAQSKEKEAAARMQLEQQRAEHEQAMEEVDRRLEHLEKMTELELKYNRNVPGSAV